MNMKEGIFTIFIHVCYVMSTSLNVRFPYLHNDRDTTHFTTYFDHETYSYSATKTKTKISLRS